MCLSLCKCVGVRACVCVCVRLEGCVRDLRRVEVSNPETFQVCLSI